MKVLVACEESQRVCMAFRAKGHEDQANAFALDNAKDMPKRTYCPECGAWMRGDEE